MKIKNTTKSVLIIAQIICSIAGITLSVQATHQKTTARERMLPIKHDNRYFYNQEDCDTSSFIQPLAGIWHKFPALIMRELPHFFNIKKQPLCNWPTVPEPTFPERSKKPWITWINQSSFLIQIGNRNILIDPAFSDCPPLRRTHKPGFSWEKLPKIDLIIISHNHKDHTDFDVLQKITQRDNPTYLLPLDNGPLFARNGITNCIERNWWESVFCEREKKMTALTITCLPARHWSCRQLTDARTALWSSWMIECNGYTIYYAGDTGYGDHFAQIADQFPKIDVAIMPIHPIKSSPEHVGPGDSISAFLELNADIFIPTHWGTFSLESYPGERPIQRLIQHWQLRQEELTDKTCLIYLFGETKNIERAVKKHNQGATGLIGITNTMPLLEPVEQQDTPSIKNSTIDTDDEQP